MTYRRHPDLRMTALSGEGVVLHLGTRRYFSVNETGLVLLEAMERPRTLSELAQALMDRYEVGVEHASASAQAFLERCSRAELVVTEAV